MRLTLTLFFCTLFAMGSQAQCDTIANACIKHISNKYVSDGQLYRSLLYEDQVAEFKTTLYGGTKYRLAACSGFENGNLIFSVFDSKRNLLFTNSDYDNSPYWDFDVESTLDVIVEARLDLNKLSSGCAVLLIGFEP